MTVKDKLKEQMYQNVLKIDQSYLKNKKNILELGMAIAIRPAELSTYRHLTVKLRLLLIVVYYPSRSVWYMLEEETK